MTIKPTEEQQLALDAFETGDNVVIKAGAGTGKTSTLRLLADSTRDRGIYVAYNRAIADEAAGKFPDNVQCRTAHSLAMRAVGHEYRDRLGGGFKPLWQTAKHLGIRDGFEGNGRTLPYTTLARLAQEMVDNFCNSADAEIGKQHVPFVEGLIEYDEAGNVKHNHHRELAVVLLPHAQRAWTDLLDPKAVDSPVRFKHDHYLKIWQLGNPTIRTDYILFDEAQDANPVIASIIQNQDCQIVPVGDDAQSIYAWRGAINALDTFDADRTVFLTQSFRFGPAVAEFANAWLEQLDTPLRLRGTESIESVVGPLTEQPRALLARSNAGSLAALLNYQQADVKAHLVGGASDIGRFCTAVIELQTTGKTSHRDLMAFTSWEEVVQYVKDDKKGAGDLATWVSILDRYGVDTVRNALANQHADEDTADVTISTAHKAKGREWSSVRIADDFAAKVDKESGEVLPLSDGEIMLRYVAVTRAMNHLDPGVLVDSVGRKEWNDLTPLDVLGEVEI